MPNWCENIFKLRGNVEAMDKWRIALSNKKSMEPLLSFEKLIPLPEEENNNWYEWRIQNWGTKWDIIDGNGDGVEPGYCHQTECEYFFDTAWSPPIPFLYEMSKRFPDIEFELAYLEPGVCFAGHYIVQDGKEIKDYITNDPHEMNRISEELFGYLIWEDDEILDAEQERA